jgi:hypothetical protein
MDSGDTVKRLWVVALAWAAPLQAQTAAPGREPAIPNGFLGYTFCRAGLGETWIRADIVDTPQAEEVLAHEAVHRRQAEEAPSCEAFFASLTSARRVVEVEIPAYCAQWRVLERRGAKREATFREYALRISAQAGATENRLDVFAMLEEECGRK